MRRSLRLSVTGIVAGLLFASLSACATVPPAPDPQIERDAIAARMLADIEVLASDEFGGRKPGTPGGEKTVAYLIDRMKQIGLLSGTNDPGSVWRAPVELVSSRPLTSQITVRTAAGNTVLPAQSSAAFSHRGRILIDGVEVIYVGDGTHAIPASDIAGRIVVLTQDDAVKSKLELVLETIFAAGPAAIITIVPNIAAHDAARKRYDRESLLLADAVSDRLTAFVTSEAFSNALPDGEWQRLKDMSARPDFVLEELEATIAIDVSSQRREFTSSNVIGVIPGAVPGSGAVLLMAHWDHLGKCAPGTPNPICNGAVDNASGLALILELAARLKAQGPFDRDIYFLATSAEESGLLGAKAFVDAPPMPLESIAAAFNFDTVAVARKGGPVGFVGEGRTNLDGLVRDELTARGMELGNREFADSFLKRHDGWVFLERGVPSVLLSTSFASEIVLGPYLATDYHRPGDEVQGIELGGAVDDLLLHEALVKRIAGTQSVTASEAQASQ